MENLAWPGVVLLFGVFVILIFRKPLTRFLDRAQRIGREGIQAAPPDQENLTAGKLSPTDEALKIFDNALLLLKENSIRQELTELKIGDPAERERFLIRTVAAVAIAIDFDRAYAWIWGSQIAALQALNTVGANGFAVELLRPWYEQAKAQEPARYQGYSFEQWLGFLGGQSLVKVAGTSVSISLEGREFLQYLIRQGYTLYKPG